VSSSFLKEHIMALQALKNINRTQGAAEAPKDKGFPALLEKFKSEIARALPKHSKPK
jgi:recombination protein RecT